jgi:hypothetical protein
MDELKYKKVEGNASLSRNMSSHAIINTNKEEYSKYIMKKNIESDREIEISNLKQDVKEIKSMLEFLLEQKINGNN